MFYLWVYLLGCFRDMWKEKSSAQGISTLCHLGNSASGMQSIILMGYKAVFSSLFQHVFIRGGRGNCSQEVHNLHYFFYYMF